MKEKEAQLQGEVDEEEDRRYGRDQRGDELPAELAFRGGRLERIREAMAALEAEAQAAAEQAEAEGKDHPGVPDDKAQRNFTETVAALLGTVTINGVSDKFPPIGRRHRQCRPVGTRTRHHQTVIAPKETWARFFNG